ncbi:MAG: hypothetical protein FOGNACKC_03523 [Anaerolineae bacterium]|nr:hypothetical protein [Anaerolineae bacterium]
MIDRDLLLILVGGLIGAASSIGTLIVSYILEGMRLRRHWQREDQLLLRQKRNELQNFLAKAGQQEKTDE